MPLARLSMKSAVHLASSSVTRRRTKGGLWVVRSFVPSASGHAFVDSVPCELADAIVRMCQDRAFIAMTAMGVPVAEADAACKRVNFRRSSDWRSVVSRYMERRALVR